MLAIRSLTFNEKFPLSTEAGSDCSGINHSKMKAIAYHSLGLNRDQVQQIMETHHQFLASGGGGGKWQILQISDIVVGFYDLDRKTEGEQAVFEKLNITATSFNKLEFPFANFCGVFAESVDFSFSNLGYSLFTDASLNGANFEGADLKNIDFSRSSLRNVNFKNANLSGVDFENCDLTGANFSNVKLNTARFPGAKLVNIVM